MPSRIELTSSKLSNINQLQQFTSQLKKPSSSSFTNEQLISQNKRILQILKTIQTKIDKQLQIHKKNMLLVNPNHKVTFNKDQAKLLQQKQVNNTKLITVLEKDIQNVLIRKKLLEDGLEERTIQKKHQLEDKRDNIKLQIKKIKIQQKQTEKKFKSYSNHQKQPQYMKEFMKIQEQLRIYSAKYVKIMAKYNKITQQLAVAAQIQPQFQIPQQIYNRQLQQKQQAQYKQYKSIVKLCTILSKRNDSQNNKSNRIYTQKLKQLQKTILHLTQLQKSISFKQTQVLEGKKNIEMIKIKMENNQKVQKELFRISQASSSKLSGINEHFIRQKSYSSVKLLGNTNNDKEQYTQNKLRSRGSSFAKLPTKIK